MKLFIDTHAEKIIIALIGKQIIIKEKITNHEHSKNTLKMINDILEENHLEKQVVKEIIVVNGPGSFTGVRIGVVIAKTLAYTLNIPIKTISSVKAFELSDKDEKDITAISDPKGYFYKNTNSDELFYLKKEEFENFVKNNNYKVSFNKKLDLNRVNNYLKDIESIDPKLVNPIYIKRISTDD